MGADGSGGTDAGTGGGGPVPAEGKYLFQNNRGPRVMFTPYEAEDMATNGQIQGPTREFGQVAAEASGRKMVRLDAEGEYVSFTNRSASNAIVVRYSIPDGGADYWTTLTVSVDGVEHKLDVTSRYSWSYGGTWQAADPVQNNPSAGNPHHYFDETRALIGDVPMGATVQIKKAAGDAAAHYDIDLVELEQAPAPLAQPLGYKSVVECGAVASDGQDDTAAFQSCLNNQGALVYIPEGKFDIDTEALEVNRATIRGAGMWYSEVNGYWARFNCWNDQCKYYDFSIFGDTTQRVDSDGDVGFEGTNNDGVLLENIWVEHRKVGYWLGGGGDDVTIRNCRMRNLHADAVNFFGGVTNSVIENCHVRGTGDDALAAWSKGDKPVNAGNTFRHNYIQAPWKANCIAIYGGNDTKLEDNVCADTLEYPGFLMGAQFGSHAFGGSNDITRNTLLRAGGVFKTQHDGAPAHGAFKIWADQGPVDNIHVDDMQIVDASHYGIHIQGGDYVGNASFNNVTITNPASAGIFLDGAKGAADFTSVVYTGSAIGLLQVDATFQTNKVSGNSGW